MFRQPDDRLNLEQLVKLGQAQAKNDPGKAVEHFRLAVDIESQQATHHAMLGKALRNSGRSKEAVEPLTTNILLMWFAGDLICFAIMGALVGAIYKPLTTTS